MPDRMRSPAHGLDARAALRPRSGRRADQSVSIVAAFVLGAPSGGDLDQDRGDEASPRKLATAVSPRALALRPRR